MIVGPGNRTIVQSENSGNNIGKFARHMDRSGPPAIRGILGFIQLKLNSKRNAQVADRARQLYRTTQHAGLDNLETVGLRKGFDFCQVLWISAVLSGELFAAEILSCTQWLVAGIHGVGRHPGTAGAHLNGNLNALMGIGRAGNLGPRHRYAFAARNGFGIL